MGWTERWARLKRYWPRARWARVLAVGFMLVVLIVGILAVGPGDVEKIELTAEPGLDSVLARAHYTDRFQMRVPAERFRTREDLKRLVFQAGDTVRNTDTDLWYRAGAPGLTFHVLYRVRSVDTVTSTVDISTIVRYDTWVGRVYFFFVKPVHRLGMPWVFKWVVNRALDDTEP